MGNSNTHEVMRSGDERLGRFRTVCTVVGRAALVIVIGHAAVSLANALRKLLW